MAREARRVGFASWLTMAIIIIAKVGFMMDPGNWNCARRHHCSAPMMSG